MKRLWLIWIFALAICNPSNLLAKDTMTAVTSEGKEVVLNLADKTWEYAPERLSDNEVIYEDEFVRIIYAGSLFPEENAYFPKSSPKFEMDFILEAVSPTSIVRYKTHQVYSRADGSTGRWLGGSREVRDNFGNSYRICFLSIGGEESVDYDYSDGIYFGEPKHMLISICDEILKAATTINVGFGTYLFSHNIPEPISFEVPIPRR